MGTRVVPIITAAVSKRFTAQSPYVELSGMDTKGPKSGKKMDANVIWPIHGVKSPARGTPAAGRTAATIERHHVLPLTVAIPTNNEIGNPRFEVELGDEEGESE